jgi:hypothetical protein
MAFMMYQILMELIAVCSGKCGEQEAIPQDIPPLPFAEGLKADI